MNMEHTKHLEDLNKQTLQKLEEYINTKNEITLDQHAKVSEAKEKWQSAWNEFLQTLLVLEKLEI